ncbi:hypothetical protein PG996_007924 [Apiospora saccharicola]|uniref:Uncharacterized protein n=1 Tax=Apiospora saccharicola TaxID=335842 RepID=A0ABR1UWH3_9PEZI
MHAHNASFLAHRRLIEFLVCLAEYDSPKLDAFRCREWTSRTMLHQMQLHVFDTNREGLSLGADEDQAGARMLDSCITSLPNGESLWQWSCISFYIAITSYNLPPAHHHELDAAVELRCLERGRHDTKGSGRGGHDALGAVVRFQPLLEILAIVLEGGEAPEPEHGAGDSGDEPPLVDEPPAFPLVETEKAVAAFMDWRIIWSDNRQFFSHQGCREHRSAVQ